MKIGGDFIKYTMSQGWCNGCDGRYTSTLAPPNNLPDLLPVWDDASTWNLAALSSAWNNYNVAIGNMSYSVHRQIYAAWYQDDWKIGSKMTANMGVRYDLDHGAQGEWIQFTPWLSGKRPTDKNNVAPRLGFAYQMNDKQVIRGGWGLFFTELEDDALHQSYVLTQQMNVTINNNGRPDFGGNPWGGPTPTYAQLLANACDVKGLPANSVAGTRSEPVLPALDSQRFGSAVRRPPDVVQPDGLDRHAARIRQPTRRSIRTSCSPAAAVKSGGRTRTARSTLARALNYPATGPTTDYAHLPFPNWGPVAAEIMNGRANYYGWENTFTKRFANHWQANATYTLSWFKDDGGIGSLTGPYVTRSIRTPRSPRR